VWAIFKKKYFFTGKLACMRLRAAIGLVDYVFEKVHLPFMSFLEVILE